MSPAIKHFIEKIVKTTIFLTALLTAFSLQSAISQEKKDKDLLFNYGQAYPYWHVMLLSGECGLLRGDLIASNERLEVTSKSVGEPRVKAQESSVKFQIFDVATSELLYLPLALQLSNVSILNSHNNGTTIRGCVKITKVGDLGTLSIIKNSTKNTYFLLRRMHAIPGDLFEIIAVLNEDEVASARKVILKLPSHARDESGIYVHE